MARFFIDHPIFAWVLAIIAMLCGVLSITLLPIAQYPAIAPPAVSISANYPGASAQTLQDTVTQVIEQNMNGLDGLQYMSSSSTSAGSATITLTFQSGTDPNIAQVQVQNKLALATPQLPTVVQQAGVTVTKSATSFLAVIAFISEDGSMSGSDLADYVASHVQDPLSRVPGVGQLQLFGAQYAMRIWLDPNKLANYALTASDVSTAITAQNAQVSAGQLGGLPSVANQQLNATITAQTLLQTPEQFENILLRTLSGGAQVRLRDVARVELGSVSYNAAAHLNGKPAAGLAVQLATGANALETIAAVNAKIAALGKFFPTGMKSVLPYDTTPFVRLSIQEVIKTLVEAVVLVFLVMYLFLQNFRATLIPTIAVPVVLLGTFGVLLALGYSINTLTMFAMVLAIGLLVDDAIVVVENVERVMREEGLPPLEATRKSMGQITGALVGVALVLAAVFLPMAFFGGSTGVIYRQFSVTIVSAMTLSVLTAMILTPALCATLLKPVGTDHQEKTTGFFGWFNRNFNKSATAYQGAVGGILRRSVRWMLIYVVLLLLVVLAYFRIPGGFLPEEDQGIVFTQVQLPPGATVARTLKVLEQVEHHYLVDQKDAVDTVFSVAGFSFGGTGQNAALAFVKLKNWDQRTAPGLKASDVVAKAMKALSQVKDGSVYAFTPPAVTELGNANGFDMQLMDNAGLGHAALMQARNQLLGLAAQDHSLTAVRPNGQEDTPQFNLVIDQNKAGALGVALADINTTFSIAWGSSFVNNFIDRGRVKKVYVQADAPFRMLPEDINKWYVRNSTGTMVPFTDFASASWGSGSPRLERYNGASSVELLGNPGAGVSSTQAMTTMENLVAKLPTGIGFEWTGLSLQEKQAGSQAMALYAVSILIVFLCLAALYESWAIPISVILVVPIGVLGVLAAALLTGKQNDVYFQVGMLTTVGLAAKNAILIVEFAKDIHAQGKSLFDAAMEAVHLRLRPILMTSLAFILGVLPMAFASGAGAGAQNALGNAVIGGMLAATALAIFFVPLFFVVVLGLFDRGDKHGAPATPPAPDAPVPPTPALEGH